MRSLAVAGLSILLAASAARAGDRAASSRDVSDVLELFTAQGCSSCPPADRLLTEYARRPGIVALAYHVDYWDYIGWRDTLSSRKNTERQRDYARSFGTGSIYTPQMVVNGRHDVVGSRRDAIDRAMAGNDLSGAPQIELRVEDGSLRILADAPPGLGAAPRPVLMLATFDDETRTAISRGENSGLSLVNSHAVRDWRALATLGPKPLELAIPMAMLDDSNGRRGGCAVFLQASAADGVPGPILAAAVLEFDGR